MMKNTLKICAATLFSTLLAACGGGGSTSATQEQRVAEPQAFGLMRPVESAEELGVSLRRGLQNSDYVSSNEGVTFTAELLDFDAAPVADSGAAEGGGFSTTNLQEIGVDEADIVKYDGEILYVVDYGQPQYSVIIDDDSIGDDFINEEPAEEELSEPSVSPEADVLASSLYEPQPPVIRLFQTQPDIPTAEPIAELSLSSPDYSVDGLYIRDDGDGKQLLALGQTSAFVYWELFASDYYWRNGRTIVQAWDVDTPNQVQESWALELDGSLLSSRRVENTLYLVTRYSPSVEGLIAYPNSAADIDSNQALIEATPTEQLLPTLTDTNGLTRELVAAEDCYIPNEEFTDITVPPTSGSLITVTAIDLDAPENTRSICLLTYASGFYASQQALYVTANSGGNSTLIHKVALLADGPEYRGSGEVTGYIGTGTPAFLMSEHQGDLRVISSSWENRFFPLPVIEPALVEEPQVDEPLVEEESAAEEFGRHRLTILRESADGTRLETIAQLPNAQRPAPIGKPNEDVYAARFIDDRAYVVTFEVIDPLYVIDLSDPEDPQIAGELEIPGFSTLLQPMGENLLLGIGHEVLADLQQGVKLALFDVADVTAPIILSEVIIGKRGTYSPALYNHHSLTLLENEGAVRVALPIERYAREMEQGTDISDPWYYYGWSDSGLYMFDVDPGLGTIEQSGSLITESASDGQPYSYQGIYNGRSVIHDQAVFFINNGSVHSQFWGSAD